MPMGLPHRIAVVGAGLMGSALAGHLILGGSSGPGDSQRPRSRRSPRFTVIGWPAPTPSIQWRVAPDGRESPSRSRGRSSERTSAARQRVNIATT